MARKQRELDVEQSLHTHLLLHDEASFGGARGGVVLVLVVEMGAYLGVAQINLSVQRETIMQIYVVNHSITNSFGQILRRTANMG